MKVRNFYKSKTDLNQLNGIRQLLLPVIARFYQCETEGTERIKESSLPLTTLLNCMETILGTLYDQDYPELSVNEIWDSLKQPRGKPQSRQTFHGTLDLEYDYHVNRWYEATVIFGAVFFL